MLVFIGQGFEVSAAGKPHVVIVTPALPQANNGNGQTSLRYANYLQSDCTVQICEQWAGPVDGHPVPDAMIALHAKKSSASIQAWARYKQASSCVPGLAVVLSGTDLYCDLPVDVQALESLKLASHLVVLQELGIQSIPPAYRPKAQVIHQCSDINVPRASESDRSRFQVIQVGHMREVKDPATFMQAARLLNTEPHIQWLQLGRCLDEQYLPMIRETQAINPNYTWLDGVDHESAVKLIAQSDLLVHSSIAEGSPHVVIEAMALGTPVLASQVDGNVGTLGTDYEGYFPVRDAQALAAKVNTIYTEWKNPNRQGLLATLTTQVKTRAPLFTEAQESSQIRGLLTQLLQ